MSEEYPSPRQFLKARHPDRFSDSVIADKPVLDRTQLEFYLDSLTSRKQEALFETFARHLVEREICPNLLPQTGPTGGGDGKTDSETYPVADALSLGWYTGIGREAASEKWAFAFSAMKAWRPKVRSDVAKIAATNRGYLKAFFVSNHYVSARNRAEVEDQLRQSTGLDVHILDLTWILDKVFENGYEMLAIEDLGMAVSTSTQTDRGPHDLQRERELDGLETRIKDLLAKRDVGPHLAEACLDAAILSAQLEQPRIKTDGRFDRAERVAEKHGLPHQKLECAYQRAWIAYWWHEDYDEFVARYLVVEERAKGTENAHHLQLLTNLWTLLFWAVQLGTVDATTIDMRARTDALKNEQERLSMQGERLSAALQCRAMLLQTQLIERLTGREEELDPVLLELAEVVHQCEGLAGFPFEPLAQTVVEMGQVLGSVAAYQELFEAVVAMTSTRAGEVAAARMLLVRGQQQLEAGLPYEAIRWLGRGLRRLYKHESRRDCAYALYLCACAYELVGLLWAARGTLLWAASLATAELSEYGALTPLQLACYSRLWRAETKLGRLPHVLAWYEVYSLVRNALLSQGHEEGELPGEETKLDVILGMLLLRTEMSELRHLSRLPDVLESLGLPYSAVALTYALGHEDEIPDAARRGLWGEGDPHELFLTWRDQPAAEGLLARPSACEGGTVRLESAFLGCQVTAESDNEPSCVELTESVLAAFESLLATCMADHVIAREPNLSLTVRQSETAKYPFEFQLREDSGRPHIHIACSPFDPRVLSLDAQDEMQQRLFELLATTMARILLIPDPESLLDKLFGDELALERSLGFTGTFVAIHNVLGHDPKTKISDWYDERTRDFPLLRSEPWDASDPIAAAEGSSEERPRLTPGQGSPPPSLNLSTAKHSEIRTVSLIREALWNEAGWRGIGFMGTIDDSQPPVLAPIFADPGAARQIFAEWRAELGERDDDERLRIVIIEGINEAKPYSYRVHFTSSPDAAPTGAGVRYVFWMGRTHTMEPDSDLNLRRFLQGYEKWGMYVLAPAVFDDQTHDLKVLIENSLTKRELHIRKAWEIGRHDVDGAALYEDDDPIIPAGQDDAPVLELLRWKREQVATLRETPPNPG